MQQISLTEEILDILSDDARTSPDTIATMLDIDVDTVRKEIARLEQNDIILKYATIINEDKIAAEEAVHALIEVKVMPQYQRGYEAIARAIDAYPEVSSCYLMSGSYDFMVLIDGDSVREIARFVAEKLSVLEGVTSTTTHFVLRKYKDNHVIIPTENEDQRQVVTP